MSKNWNGIPKTGLYDPQQDHDSCGVGLVANIDGKKEHAIIEKALSVIGNLVHRGALGGDLKTGDGAGLIFQIPHDFFKKVTPLCGIKLPDDGKYGAGMIFLSQDKKKKDAGIDILKQATEETGGKWLGIREVPTDSSCLGEIALSGMPQIVQIFVKFDGIQGDELERKLYLMRKIAENNAVKKEMHHIDFYVCSLSGRTINYKGLLLSQQVKQFFPDLSDKEFKSGLAVVHQRFSTNTFPTWPLAQPFRFMAHNGEINTLRGNINKMQARETSMESSLFRDNLKKLFPVIDPEGSDSGMFDNTFELLVHAGRSMEHSMMMMVPEAFGIKYHISQDKRSFYEYHANFMEPWDGPAALVFTDGIRIGATLDRNGLRPCRYTITKDGFVYLASECGVIDIPAENIQKKGRLQPGKIFMIDTALGRIMEDNEIKAKVSRKKPYRHWISKNRIELKGLFSVPSTATPDKETILQRQILFGYTNEDLDMILEPMATNGQEPTNSMGKDVSLPILSKKPQLMFNYFKQLFAQVTNPPIDPIREGLVMSLMSFIGREQNLLDETPKHCERLKLLHPVLTNEDLNKIKTNIRENLKSAVVSSLFKTDGKKDALKNALEKMFTKASEEIKNGASVIILSDRMSDEKNAPIPILLAAAGLHHHLIRSGQRSLASIIVETGEAREVNHFALLTGYGTNAINPYLAFESLTIMKDKNILPEEIELEDAIDKYITSIKKGLLKVFSKMGISTLRSYNSAQIFEAIGVSKNVIDKYFTNTPSRIEGIDLDGIEKETLERHKRAFVKNNVINMLGIGGTHRLRIKTENHLWNPFTIKMLQKAVREKDYNAYKEFAEYINNQSEHLCTIRGLFKFKKSTPIPIDEVEPVSEIVKRFVTGAMSFGSISREAHESMAVAMNRLGGKSNTGEGGEETIRFKPRPDGTSARSAIKQVASGRFGVTTEYLANSDEMQIKMAQGAKPGEGGQLPGFKVDQTIANVRHSTPGVTLISPPPHHDIYS
ncbi:MAG: glutamate synthase large subunit, partial [Spirochaetes bacterium]|nr:glutamate synthase large subunit [Spirochaetota bacterium]